MAIARMALDAAYTLGGALLSPSLDRGVVLRFGL